MQEYPAGEHPKPLVSADVVLLTIRNNALHVVLVRRPENTKEQHEPFPYKLALIGRMVRTHDDLDDEAVARAALLHKVGLEVPYLEQLRTFANARRDPRGWSVSIAQLAVLPDAALAHARQEIEVWPVDDLPNLAFDHSEIMQVAIERLRSKASYSSLPTYLLPQHFSLGQLHKVYEAVQGRPQNVPTFRKKILEQGFIEEVPDAYTQEGTSRPAQLYRRVGDSLAMTDRTIAPAASTRNASAMRM